MAKIDDLATRFSTIVAGWLPIEKVSFKSSNSHFWMHPIHSKHVLQILQAYRYLSSIFVCLINKLLNFQGIFLSQFRCCFTLEFSTVRIRSGSNMDIILLSFFTEVIELVWTDVD